MTAASPPPTKMGSRWLTCEFLLYYLIILNAAYHVLSAAYNFSQVTSAEFGSFKDQLGAGWMFGRLLDTSDHQWRSFRSSLPLAIVLFVCYSLASYFIQRWNRDSLSIAPRAYLCLCVLVIFHGFNAVKIIGLAWASFMLGRLPGRWCVAASWLVGVGTLFCLEYFPLLRWMPPWLWTGFVPRWHVTLNVFILRLLSFNLDRHQSLHPPAIKQHCSDCTKCSEEEACDRQRTSEPAPSAYFDNLHAFFLYVFYAPLYFAGPIITFNDFISQLKRPLKSQLRTRYVYGLRLVGTFLTLEVLLHLFWVVAIKDARSWSHFRPVDFAALAYLNLKVVYLKLLVIWRFFRFWAFVDGIVPPENMLRCISNSHSVLGFWRSWHSSYNRWIIRYMYLPMGGRSTAIFNIWLIFSFVAIWHDLRLHLLAWSWIICLAILPEILINGLAAKQQWHRLPHYRHIRAIGAATLIFLLCAANLVGFVVGISGLQAILNSFFSRDGLLFMAALAPTLFAAAQLQIEYREAEKRRGINNKF